MYFPEYLKQRYNWYLNAERKPKDDQKSLKEILDFFRKENGFKTEPHLFFTSDHLHFDKIAVDAEYEVCINSELRKTLNWISRKVLNTIGIDNYLSTNVYIRIGTSMLNNLVKKGTISKEFGIYYHDNLVANMSSLLFTINTEDLPF